MTLLASNLNRWMFLLLIILHLSPKYAEATDSEKGHPMIDLETQIKNAQPGDIITLKTGIYEAEKYHFVGKGTADQPIVIRAETRGKTIFKSPILIEGEYLTLEGCHFEKNGNIEIEGTGIRLTQCTMTDVQKGKWVRVRPGSRQIEIDHCRFANKTNNLTEPRGCQLLQIVVRNQGEKHHIHHNHIVDIPKRKSRNGYETIQHIT
ncbi:MAG: chondroitinase-B domain-containing protein, partial [Candidatus Latescibacterota bacterium]